MIFLYPLFLLSYCFSLAIAQYPPSEICFRACELALRSTVRFNATNPKTGWTCSPKTCDCVSEIGTASLYLCTRLYCSEKETLEGLGNFNSTCRALANVTAPPFSSVDHFGDAEVEKLRRVRRKDVYPVIVPVAGEIVLPDEQLFDLAKDTLDTAYFEAFIHIAYGISMYIFWFIVIVIGLTSHFAKYIADKEPRWHRLPENDPLDSENSAAKRNQHLFSTPYILLKRYITVPATFGYTRSQNISWWATIPTRIQSITIATFVVLNTVLCSISYRAFEDNLYWRDEADQMTRYIADRTGVISTANLALIWLFGIRNNTLMWLTGWDFATYNNFHRWVGRVAAVEAVVHSVVYTYKIVQRGSSWSSMWDMYAKYLAKKYFWNGVLATIFMSLICGFSIYGIRRNFYETFLALHISLSVLVLVTMWYHVEIFSGLYNWYLYPCFFIWIFDRISRIIRILLFNIRFWSTKAVTTYNHDSNMVRLTIPYSTSFVRPRPGTFYYISSLNSLQIWESHPFTLSYSTPSAAAHELSQSTTHSRSHSHGTISPPYSPPQEAADTRSPYTTTYESEALLKTSPTAPPTSLTFLIRPYKGFTSRLRTSALRSPSVHRVLIDGPYGETQQLHQYQNVLFIIGGAGIAVPLSYLDVLTSEESRTESIKVVWAVREAAFLHETLDVDFRDHLSDERISVCAYLTRANANNSNSPESGNDQDRARPFSESKGAKVQRGRPNVSREIEEVAQEAGRASSLAVVACGPGVMADDARRAVVCLLGRGFGRVEYFEESFNW